MAALRIKQVADASGFTTATLRYYEQRGLLPAAIRSAAGYRLYDQGTLDRLAFITRAKQLGCTLGEITDLVTAWEGGRCGPVQDRLRQLVAGKIGTAQSQMAELLTFTAELQQAAASLERHRPQGACDAECGCVAEPQAVALMAKPVGDAAIACTLGSGQMKGRIEDWQALLAHVSSRTPLDDGVRAVLAASVPMDELVRLVAAEHDCCQFFSFAITVDGRGVALEVRAPADARPIVDAVFGVAA